jgi:hypothetical protein
MDKENVVPPGVVALLCNPTNLEAEAGGSQN